MAESPVNTERPAAPVPVPASHAIMFWVLSAMAMGLFAACALVPIWVETEEILDHERSAVAVLDELKAQAGRNDARIKALLADPVVNERIVRRELNYRREGEQVVPFPGGELNAVELVLPEPLPTPTPKTQIEVPSPAWLVSVRRWLPDWPWRKLFAESPNRALMLAMAGGLLATAFLLYGPTSISARRQPHQA